MSSDKLVDRILLASTGIIGQHLDMEKIKSAVDELSSEIQKIGAAMYQKDAREENKETPDDKSTMDGEQPTPDENK